MESKVKEAVQRKMCGYNCAQAVACTYCEQAGLDEETVKNLTQGFAVGMGGSMEATCGAIIGAINVLGMINKNPQKTMQSARRIISRFKEQNGTVICKELKGIADGVVRRECIDCVKDAAVLLEDELKYNQKVTDETDQFRDGRVRTFSWTICYCSEVNL